MKKSILFYVGLLFMFSCGGGSSDSESKPISIDKTNVSLYKNKYEDITILNYNTACVVKNSNDYVCAMDNYSGNITLRANHVGKDTVTISNESTIIKCFIEVKGEYNDLGNPVLKFGIDKNKLAEEASSTSSKWGGFTETDKEVQYKENTENIYHTYSFKNGKLYMARTDFHNAPSQSNILLALSERYDADSEIGSSSPSAATQHWYKGDGIYADRLWWSVDNTVSVVYVKNKSDFNY